MKGTYENIHTWVKTNYGYYPKTCWIAHVKELCGLPVKQAWNRNSPERREVPCPPENIEHLKAAFKHFSMV